MLWFDRLAWIAFFCSRRIREERVALTPRCATVVIDDQRFIVARDIDGEPPRAGERAADQLQIAGVGLILGNPTAHAAAIWYRERAAYGR